MISGLTVFNSDFRWTGTTRSMFPDEVRCVYCLFVENVCQVMCANIGFKQIFPSATQNYSLCIKYLWIFDSCYDSFDTSSSPVQLKTHSSPSFFGLKCQSVQSPDNLISTQNCLTHNQLKFLTKLLSAHMLSADYSLEQHLFSVNWKDFCLLTISKECYYNKCG